VDPVDDDAAAAGLPTAEPAGEVDTGATGVRGDVDPGDGDAAGDGVGDKSEGEDGGDSIVAWRSRPPIPYPPANPIARPTTRAAINGQTADRDCSMTEIDGDSTGLSRGG
jgi:hypothetical protein